MKYCIITLVLLLSSNFLFGQVSYRVENVVAVTKLVGIVKYFYPNYKTTKIDWDSFTKKALEIAKEIRNNAELKDSLNNIFRKIAPELNILFEYENCRLSLKSKSDNSPNKGYFWKHDGYGYDKKEYPIILKLFFPWKSKFTSTKNSIDNENIPVVDSIYSFILNDSLVCTLPLCVSKVKNISIQTNDDQIISSNEKLEQLNSLINIWNVIQHFYVYLDDTNYDWDDLRN